ncbi:MAG TPA: diacylglycerol kinase family protein [Planctomycetota bacterium]|nr:diacylglycerol kinase family protein [Planctomycetota bacterium]
MKVHVIANPAAGRGRTKRLVEGLSRALGERGATVSVHWTTGAGDARAHVAALPDAAADRLAVVGGDGTLHEVVNARERPLPWPVALCPRGTANLVARDAAVPLRASVERWADLVTTGRPWEVDLLATDRGRALAVVGAGLDAQVVRAVAAARGTGKGGYSRWLLPIARSFLDYRAPRLHVVVDGTHHVEGGAVIVQNTNCYGGIFTLSRDACMDDGRLDVIVLRGGRRRDHFRMLLRAFEGGLERDRDVEIRAGTSVEVRSDPPTAVQIDGDPAGETPLTARVVPHGLTLLRP